MQNEKTGDTGKWEEIVMSMEQLLKEPENFNKIRSIVTYFAYKMGSGGPYLSPRRLMKLYYMAEIKSIQKFQKRLSKVDFLNWKHGPWSLDVILTADTIDDVEIIEAEKGKRVVPALDKTKVELTKDETDVLREVVDEWKYEKVDDLVAKAKSTPPFTWSEKRQKIDFERLIEFYEKTYGNPELLEVIKESRLEIARGEGITITGEKEIANFITSF